MKKKHCIEFFPEIHVFFLDQHERGLHLESNQPNQVTINCEASSQADFIPLKIPQFP